MADLITFSADIARRLMRMLLAWERGLDDTPNRRKRRPIGDEGGGGANLVRFRIISADNCGTCTATAQVLSIISGGSTVPGRDPDTGYITIYGKVGCELNGDTDAMEFQKGYAAYMTTVDDRYDPCPGLPTTCWEIVSLCPYNETC